MKTNVLIALTALITVFTACQKDPKDPTDNGGGDITKDYQPMTANSSWQYSSTTLGNYTETATGMDTTVNGDKYSIFNNSQNGRRYYRKSDNSYYMYGYVDVVKQTINILYLKDVAVGTTWTNTASYSGIPIELKYTVASQGGEKTVNNKAYKDVIGLQFVVTASSPLGGGATTVATGQSFYAKGVGLITQTVEADVLGTQISDSTYLVSSDIK